MKKILLSLILLAQLLVPFKFGVFPVQAAIELSSYSTLYNDANLLAYWKLENTNDEKGTYNLTNTNSVAFNAAKFNNGADFGSTNSTKMLSYSGTIGGANDDRTMCVWIKPTYYATNGDSSPMAVSYTTENVGYHFRVYNNTQVPGGLTQFFRQNYCSPGSTAVTYATDLVDGNWHMICGVRSSTSIYLYIDGVNRGSAGAGSGTGTCAGVNGFSFSGDGSSTSDSDRMMSGLIDDASYFTRALSDSEISNYYNATAAAHLRSPINYIE